MRASTWQEPSFELAPLLAYQASKALVNPAFSGGEQLLSPRPMAGFGWNVGAMRKVSGHQPSGRIQRALRSPLTEE